MDRPIHNITFTKAVGTEVSFNFCNSFETDESYEHLTDTAKIIVPRKLSMDGIDLFSGTNPVFKRGDQVKIEAGYYPNKRVIFNGYISKIHAKIPVEIECEDRMFLLKEYTVSYPDKYSTIYLGKNGRHLKRPKIISANISLKELMDNIIADDIEYRVLDDIKLGQFRVQNATPAQVLDKLKSEYGLFSYFVDGVLTVGFANDASDTIEEEFEMERVIINSDDLEYQIEEDVKLKVKAVSMMPDNAKIEVEVGDSDGEQKTIHKYNLNEADLRKVALKWLEEFKYTGFIGNLETFGEPYLRHGDRCRIVSKKLPERNGSYLITSVKRKLSVDGGYRQIFSLGTKVE
jgi:hypothetical protein